MVVQPDSFMLVVIFSFRRVIPGLGGDSQPGDLSGLPAPGALDISGGGVPWSTASRRVLSVAVMGEGGVSRLPIKDGVYPEPVSSGWKVPTGVLGSPVSMGRCHWFHH